MKQPILLKTVLDILFILLIVGMFASIILIVSFWLFSEKPLPFLINDQEVNDFNTVTIISIALVILSKMIFIYIIYRLKLLVRLFFKRKIFSLDQAKNLKIIGNLIILLGILDILAVLIYYIFPENQNGAVRLNFDFGGFDSFWFVLALGLFFVYMSKVFDNARILKEENELTI